MECLRMPHLIFSFLSLSISPFLFSVPLYLSLCACPTCVSLSLLLISLREGGNKRRERKGGNERREREGGRRGGREGERTLKRMERKKEREPGAHTEINMRRK